MRVLFVTRKYPPQVGGMESLSYELTTGYPEPKTIIALRRSQLHLVWFLPYALARVALSAHRYDVIHLGDALLCGVGWFPRALGRPVVVSLHGLDLTFPRAIYQKYLNVFLRGDAFVANSAATLKLAEARGLTGVSVIGIGVPARYFTIEHGRARDQELEARGAGRTLLLSVGRLVRRKGVAWFVREVLPKLGDVLYVVVGEGLERAEIERAAREASVSDKLWLTGRVSEERLRAIFASAHIFVMPNIQVPGDVEGFGIVAVEAAASGLPVVAARLEGIPDAISDGENGALLEPGNAEAFVEAIRALAANPSEAHNAGERARAFTRENNAWPRIVERYRALFASVMRKTH